MKAVAPRIDKLYEKEVERWRAAWKQFSRTFWGHLTNDELRAYNELFDNEPSEERFEAVEQQMVHWFQEVWNQFYEKPLTEEQVDEGKAWQEAFFDAWPLPDEVDLSRWPENVPFPPDEDVALAKRADEALIRLCRERKREGDIERLAAAQLIFNVAVCKTARVYSNEGSKS